MASLPPIAASIMNTAVSLDALRIANQSRSARWSNGQKLPIEFHQVELEGERGEAMNAVKKLCRLMLNMKGGSDTRVNLAEELADTVISADLVAMEAGINLAAAVKDKFNATSEKHGFPERLDAELTTMDIVMTAATGSPPSSPPPPPPSLDVQLLVRCTRWMLDKMQGDSGTWDTYWEQFPEYRDACAVVAKLDGLCPPPAPRAMEARVIEIAKRLAKAAQHNMDVGGRVLSASALILVGELTKAVQDMETEAAV